MTTKSRYGLRALIDLAEQDLNVPQPIGQIAERQDLSVKYLEQTFLLLRKAGLIRSVKGVRGGYLLADDPARITLEQVIAALEGDTDIVGMAAGPAARQTPLQRYLDRAVWEPLNRMAATFYAGKTLADMAGKPNEGGSPLHEANGGSGSSRRSIRLARSGSSK